MANENFNEPEGNRTSILEKNPKCIPSPTNAY